MSKSRTDAECVALAIKYRDDHDFDREYCEDAARIAPPHTYPFWNDLVRGWNILEAR